MRAKLLCNGIKKKNKHICWLSDAYFTPKVVSSQGFIIKIVKAANEKAKGVCVHTRCQ